MASGKVRISDKNSLSSRSTSALMKILKHYGLDNEMEMTDRGTILVHYDGTMYVNTVHAVDVDIQAVKLRTAASELFL